MKLSGLASLYKSMRLNKIDRYQFDYKVNNVVFDIFFFIDENPFSLLFGVKKENFSFEVAVRKGFEIDSKLDQKDYTQLCEILGLKYDPNNTFSTSSFFNDFNKAIPKNADIMKLVQPDDLIRYRNDVEEADKIYFRGWKDNKIRNESVSVKNLEKTKRLLGEKAYLTCKAKNISSCWTNDVNRKVQVTIPT